MRYNSRKQEMNSHTYCTLLFLNDADRNLMMTTLNICSYLSLIDKNGENAT